VRSFRNAKRALTSIIVASSILRESMDAPESKAGERFQGKNLRFRLRAPTLRKKREGWGTRVYWRTNFRMLPL
jgi:hypothetical protein